MREVPEWVGKDGNSAIPPRVRLRQFERDGGRCQCGCGILIRPGDEWETDHLIAIANGGANAESNLRTILKAHHKEKTAADVAEKSRVYRKRSKHIGLKKSSRPMPGSKASGWKHTMSGDWVRR